jgi:hypothetical protein
MIVSASIKNVLWDEIAVNSSRELNRRMNVHSEREREKKERLK